MYFLRQGSDILGEWTNANGRAIRPPVLALGAKTKIHIVFLDEAGDGAIDFSQYDNISAWIGDYADKINVCIDKSCCCSEEYPEAGGACALVLQIDCADRELTRAMGVIPLCRVFLEVTATDSTGVAPDFVAQGFLHLRNRISPLPLDARESAILGSGVLGLMILGKE